MDHIARTIETNYSNNKYIKNNYSTVGALTTKEADALVAEAADLISDPNFRPFFFKTLYIIGPVNFREAVQTARNADKAKCKPCVFVNRLKEHRRGRQ